MATTLSFPTAAFSAFVVGMDGLGDVPIARVRLFLAVLKSMQKEKADIDTFPTPAALSLYAAYLSAHPEEREALGTDHDAA